MAEACNFPNCRCAWEPEFCPYRFIAPSPSSSYSESPERRLLREARGHVAYAMHITSSKEAETLARSMLDRIDALLAQPEGQNNAAGPERQPLDQGSVNAGRVHRSATTLVPAAPSEKVERMHCGLVDGIMRPKADGTYVYYADYAKLERELEEWERKYNEHTLNWARRTEKAEAALSAVSATEKEKRASPTWDEVDAIRKGKSDIDLAERIWQLERELAAHEAWNSEHSMDVLVPLNEYEKLIAAQSATGRSALNPAAAWPFPSKDYHAVGYVDLAGVAHWEPGRLPQGVEAMLYISRRADNRSADKGQGFLSRSGSYY